MMLDVQPEKKTILDNNVLNPRSWFSADFKVRVKKAALQARKFVAIRGISPSFLIIGAQKSGTSSLFNLLRQHPDFAAPMLKDVYYFDNNYDKGEQWYLQHFPPEYKAKSHLQKSNRDLVTAEAATYYCLHPHVPKRIAEFNNGLPLVFIVRDPVKRAISHYYHNLNNGRETRSMEEAFFSEAEMTDRELALLQKDKTYISSAFQHFSYLIRGDYIDQIKQYLKVFPKQQLLVLTMDELSQDTQKTFDKLCAHVGLPPFTLLDQSASGSRVLSKPPEPDPELISWLAQRFSEKNNALFAYLGKAYNWTKQAG